MAQINLTMIKNIHDYCDKQRHSLQLVILPFELCILFGKLVNLHLHFEQACFKLVKLDLVFEFGGICSIVNGSLFHINHILQSSNIY